VPPPSEAEGGDALGDARETDGVRLAHPVRERRRLLREELRSGPTSLAYGGGKAGLDREGARQAIGLARAQRKEQVTGLELRRADHVHQGEADRHGPAGVHA